MISIRDIVSKMKMQYAEVAPLTLVESFVSYAQAGFSMSFGKCCYLECKIELMSLGELLQKEMGSIK